MAGFEWLINNKKISSRYLDIRDYDKSNQINIFIKAYIDYYSNALRFIKSNKHKKINANIEVSWFENHNIKLKKFIKKKLKFLPIRNRSQNYFEFSKLISNKNLILLKNLEKQYKYFDKKIKLI